VEINNTQDTKKTAYKDVQQFTVQDDDHGQRLDRYLKKHLPRLPYALLQKMIRSGQIRINGKRADPADRIQALDIIRIPPLEDKAKNVSFYPQQDDEQTLKDMTIYDDGEILVLNKPYGLPVQGGPNIKRHIDGMLGCLVNRKGVRPRLIHRLDRDTSGLLICGRSLKMTQELGKLFESRDIKKIYWAVTTPAPKDPSGIIDAAIIKGDGARKEAMVIDNENGKPSRTDFHVLQKNEKAALVAFWPRTGRMHQIRVHTADKLHAPILGDEKYGGLSPLIEDMNLDGRLHLHAARLIFAHPMDGRLLDLKAPLPSDYQNTLKTFQFEADIDYDPFIRPKNSRETGSKT
jgi:23S rRNA pseudouridine955/2504/2580 synthase